MAVSHGPWAMDHSVDLSGLFLGFLNFIRFLAFHHGSLIHNFQCIFRNEKQPIENGVN